MFFIRNLRAVIISALAIPASIISSFTLMSVMGFTLNNMTLLAITLAVGIVIDDAIVVLENIFRYIEEKNCSPYEAAIEGTREVALAVMATTLSLVVIFLPIAFMSGYAKRFINPFGWTMAFAILVSMLVSFTLTPMLSSRFLKLSTAAADHKTKERGFFHWLDQWHTRQVNWALDHPTAIIAISVVTVLLTFPLNRMVGREFVPNEDMGDWTVHVDAPEGTSLEGTTRRPFKLLKEISGIEGVAQIEPSIGVTGMAPARRPTSISSVRRCRSRAEEQPGRDHHGDAAPAGGVSIATVRRSPRGTRWAAAKGRRLPDLGQHPRSRSRADRRILEAGARGAAAAEPDRAEDQPEHLESRGTSIDARAADLGVHVDGRQHAAARGLRGRSDLVLQGRNGAVSGQDPRPRGSAARHRGDRTADRAVGERTGPHRQHRADRARPRADHAAALEPAVHGVPQRRRRAGPRLDEASNDVRRMLPASTCRRRCRSGSRGRPRSWTRPPPT